MKLYIEQVAGVWSHTRYRDDFLNTPKQEYNAQGWYDFEPTPQPDSKVNIINSHAVYLDAENIARYRWTQTLKTGEDLVRAIRDMWALTRVQRNELLQESDFTQLADAPMTPAKQAEWAAFRQVLRDMTTQADPFNLVWPISPAGRVASIGVVRV